MTKGKRALAALVVALASLPGTSSAADWQKIIDLDDKGGYLLVDRSSIVSSGKARKAWFRFVYGESQRIPQGVPKVAPNEFFYARILSLEYVNCSKRTMSTRQSLYHDSAGIVVANYDVTESMATWSEVAPDTVGEVMFTTVCQADIT